MNDIFIDISEVNLLKKQFNDILKSYLNVPISKYDNLSKDLSDLFEENNIKVEFNVTINKNDLHDLQINGLTKESQLILFCLGDFYK